MLHQFTKERSHLSVKFVPIVFQQNLALIDILHQFTKEKKHLHVKFVILDNSGSRPVLNRGRQKR